MVKKVNSLYKIEDEEKKEYKEDEESIMDNTDPGRQGFPQNQSEIQNQVQSLSPVRDNLKEREKEGAGKEPEQQPEFTYSNESETLSAMEVRLNLIVLPICYCFFYNRS